MELGEYFQLYMRLLDEFRTVEPTFVADSKISIMKFIRSLDDDAHGVFKRNISEYEDQDMADKIPTTLYGAYSRAYNSISDVNLNLNTNATIFAISTDTQDGVKRRRGGENNC